MSKNQQAPQAATPSVDEVIDWLIAFLEAGHPEVKGTVHRDMSFDSIGLDSLARVDLITALERRFGTPLEPTLAFDFVTPGALATYAWGQIAGVEVDQKQLLGV
jgi:acyl carrier protein